MSDWVIPQETITQSVTAGERALAEARRERDEARAEAEKWKAKANDIAERAIDLRQENDKLVEEKRAMAKMIAAECADPNGTIWDHAKESQAEIERLRDWIKRAVGHTAFGKLYDEGKTILYGKPSFKITAKCGEGE